MLKTAAIFTLVTWMAIPASANPTIEFMEKKLKVEPGVYTLGELVQIQHAGDDAAVRIELIDRQKADFWRKIQTEARRLGTLDTVTKSSQ